MLLRWPATQEHTNHLKDLLMIQIYMLLILAPPPNVSHASLAECSQTCREASVKSAKTHHADDTSQFSSAGLIIRQRSQRI